MEDRVPGGGYGGSRAEWILKRANDFDAKARSFRCCRCASPAVWVCLDPVCVAHNGSSVLCLCDECDQRFHPGSHPVMCRHRRLAMVLYISLIMLHRYQKIVEFISAAQQADTSGVLPSPSVTVPDEVSSTQADFSTAPQHTTEVEVVSDKVIVESPAVASYVDVAPTTSSEIDATPNPLNSHRSTSADVVSAASSGSFDETQSLKEDLRSIHESYAGVLGHIRRDTTLSLADACRREPRGKLTVKSYAAIAELQLLDPDLYRDTLEEFERRQNGSGTLSGFERDCSAVLAAYNQRVADMRTRMELLPCFTS